MEPYEDYYGGQEGSGHSSLAGISLVKQTISSYKRQLRLYSFVTLTTIKI